MIHPMRTAPIGVLPKRAIWCRAMTRPCMAGSVACWRTTVFTDWNEADANPSGMLIATKAQKVGVRARARQVAAKAVRVIARVRRRMGCHAGDVDAAEDRADRADAHGGSDRAGVEVESEVDHRGEGRREVQGHGADDGHDQQGSADIGIAAHVGEPFAQLALGSSGERPVDQVTGPDGGDGRDDDQVGGGVHDEARLGADGGDQQAGEGRSDEPGHRVDRAVRGDCAGQQVGSDELVQDRLHARSLDGQDDAQHPGERVDPPDVDDVGGDDDAQRQRQQPGEGGGDEQKPSVVDLVGEHAGRCAEQQHREELQGHGDAEPVAAVGDLEDQPDDGQGLGPRSDARDGLADEVPGEVPVPERGEPLRSCARGVHAESRNGG